MAAIPLKVRGLNVVLVVFSLVVLAGSAVAINSQQLFGSRAAANVPTPTPKPTCTARPKCLDAKPRCLIAEPAEGFCPTPSPKPVGK